MKELQFDTGLVTYKVNGGHEIKFNPGDIKFVKKLFDVFDKLAKQQDNTEKNGAEENDDKKLFELMEQQDRDMRKEIDSVFGEGSADAIFPDMSVFALAGGFPLWANFFMAVIDEIDGNLSEEERKARARCEKYMKKYNAYRRK